MVFSNAYKTYVANSLCVLMYMLIRCMQYIHFVYMCVWISGYVCMVHDTGKEYQTPVVTSTYQDTTVGHTGCRWPPTYPTAHRPLHHPLHSAPPSTFRPAGLVVTSADRLSCVEKRCLGYCVYMDDATGIQYIQRNGNLPHTNNSIRTYITVRDQAAHEADIDIAGDSTIRQQVVESLEINWWRVDILRRVKHESERNRFVMISGLEEHITSYGRKSGGRGH